MSKLSKRHLRRWLRRFLLRIIRSALAGTLLLLSLYATSSLPSAQALTIEQRSQHGQPEALQPSSLHASPARFQINPPWWCVLETGNFNDNRCTQASATAVGLPLWCRFESNWTNLQCLLPEPSTTTTSTAPSTTTSSDPSTSTSTTSPVSSSTLPSSPPFITNPNGSLMVEVDPTSTSEQSQAFASLTMLFGMGLVSGLLVVKS